MHDKPVGARLDLMVSLAGEIFPTREYEEIAHRLYCLLMCVESNENYLSTHGLVSYSSNSFGIPEGTLIKLWEHFFDPLSRADLSEPLDARRIFD